MTAVQPMRMNNFPALRAARFEEVEGLLAGKGLRAEREGPGETARFNTVYRDGWYLAHMDYDMPLRISAAADRDDYTLYLPLVGGVEASDGRDTVDCGSVRTVLTSPHRPLVTRTSAHASRVNLTIKREVMLRHLTTLLGEEPARLPAFEFAFDQSRPEVRAYLTYLWGVIAAIEQDSGFLDQPLVGAAVEQALVMGLLLNQSHDLSGLLRQDAAGPAPADVKRVVDYIEAHMADDISLADLAAAAGVPARTLQAHFRDRFDCGPMAYLRDRRLCRARQDLLAGEPEESVTAVALRWGFGSLGRFAAQYRARFGESPSQTLRGAR